MLILAYPGVEAYHRDGYALDFLTNLLAGDKKSPLYKVLVESANWRPKWRCSTTSSKYQA